MSDPTANHLWCQQLVSLLAEGGTWGVPRSGLVFRKRSGCLVLIGRMPHNAAMKMSVAELADHQDKDFALLKRNFEAAGIRMRDETKPCRT